MRYASLSMIRGNENVDTKLAYGFLKALDTTPADYAVVSAKNTYPYATTNPQCS